MLICCASKTSKSLLQSQLDSCDFKTSIALSSISHVYLIGAAANQLSLVSWCLNSKIINTDVFFLSSCLFWQNENENGSYLPITDPYSKCQTICHVEVWLCTGNHILKIVMVYLLSWIVTGVMTHQNGCDTYSVPQWCKAHCKHCSLENAPGKDSERRNATHTLEFPNVIHLDSLWKSNWILNNEKLN